jgi:hypothetical protein
MNIEMMKKEILKVYSGPKWVAKMKKMPDNQVIAIYYHFLKAGRFKKAEKDRQAKKKLEGFQPKQLSFDDVLVGWDLASGPDK